MKQFISFFALYLSSTSIFSQDQATVILKHASSVDSIQTLSCKLHIQWVNIQIAEEFAVVYCQNGKMRINHSSGPIINDLYLNDGKLLSQTLGQNISDMKSSSGIISNKDMPYNCNPWQYGLFTVAGITKFRVSLKELLSHPECKVQQFNVVGNDVVKKYVLDIVQPKINLQVVIDPNHGYLISEINYGTVVHVVEKFIEPIPGVFFPSVVKSKEKDSPRNWIVTFSDVKINTQLPKDAFNFRFAPGLLVNDSIQNEVFRTNERGEPVLPAKNASGQKISYSNSPIPAIAEKQTQREASQEDLPNRLGTWIFSISLLLLVIGVVFLFIRRRQFST